MADTTLHHSIVRVMQTLNPSRHLHVPVLNAERSRKFFPMNSTVRTPAASATSPSTFPNARWKEKVKVFLHANRLRLI